MAWVMARRERRMVASSRQQAGFSSRHVCRRSEVGELDDTSAIVLFGFDTGPRYTHTKKTASLSAKCPSPPLPATCVKRTPWAKRRSSCGPFDSGRRKPLVVESRLFLAEGQNMYGFVFRPHGCRCGFLGHAKISRPLLGRIDIHTETPSADRREQRPAKPPLPNASSPLKKSGGSC